VPGIAPTVGRVEKPESKESREDFMLRFGIALVLAASCAVLPVSAQDFPNRPVKIIVPFPPGGPVDVLARAIGEGFRERTGQPMIVENRPGANTSIGATACKNAEPDGYTVCLLTASTITLNPFLYPSLSYAPEKDLEPVSNIVIARQVLLVHKSIPAKTYAELVTYSKQNPDKVSFGSFGVGGDSHLVVEWLKNKTGLQMTHVPYPGAAPALIAFERGDIQLTFPVATAPVVQRVKSGQAKGLLIAGNKRDPNLPDTPTFKEAGLPDLEYETFFGMFAPVNVPNDRLEKLGREVSAVVRSPAFIAKYVTAGYDAVGSSPAEFKKALKGYMAAGRNLVAISGVKLSQ
jgi:tripartite-type tricarboxylate transporter receptor subunit TctC